ncbi:MAG: hypothetical protein AB7P99_16000 [Vicinamibacterales bacterium]
MRIDLNHEEAAALRELLQEKVLELDKEINRTDSLRFKEQLRSIERTLEHVLGSVSREESAAGPGDWEARDQVIDEDRTPRSRS